MKNKLIIKGNVYVAGVYCLKNVETDEVLLVGSGIECNDRLSWYIYNFKRYLFEGTNKEPLQDIYDRESLCFEILHESVHSKKVKNMTDKEKEALQKVLGTLEMMYIDLYKDTILNVHMSVTKHSSNKNKLTSYKRSYSNRGSKNPNCRYDERIVAEILWLKLNGYKKKEIAEQYKDVNEDYIPQLGFKKWVHLEPVKPDWVEDKKIS